MTRTLGVGIFLVRDARAGVITPTRDATTSMLRHTLARAWRASARHAGARDATSSSSAPSPVPFRGDPSRALRGAAGNSNRRLTAPSPRVPQAALARPDPRVQRPHSPPAKFLRRRRVERRGPLRPRRAGAASPRSEPRLSRDGGRALRGGQSRRHRGEPRGVPQGTRPRRSTQRVRAPPHPPARRRRGDDRVVGESRRRISRVDPRRRRRDLGPPSSAPFLPHLHPTARTHV